VPQTSILHDLDDRNRQRASLSRPAINPGSASERFDGSVSAMGC